MVSGITRSFAWYKNLQLDLKHMLFGTVPAGYVLYYEYYSPDQNIYLSHNNYLDVLAQTGIFGLVSFLMFFGILLYKWIRKFFQHKAEYSWKSTVYAIGVAGLIGVMLAMGLGDWMLPFPYTQGLGSFDYIVYSWILLGAVEI